MSSSLGFFSLPRELRDQIYTHLLTTPLPLPCPPTSKFLSYEPQTPSPTSSSRYLKIYDSQSTQRGEFGCAYALEKVPPTACAAFQACCRQVRSEMGEARVWLEKRGGGVALRLDCMAEDESFFYFAWRGIPLVETCSIEPSPPPLSSPGAMMMVPSWMSNLLSQAQNLVMGRRTPEIPPPPTSRTSISRLWIDVRIVGNRINKFRNGSMADRTGWAVCAALKRLFDRGPYLAASASASTDPAKAEGEDGKNHPRPGVISIDELILNVVPPPPTPSLYSPTNSIPTPLLPADFPSDDVAEGTVHPMTVARELVDVFGKLWAGDEFKGILYGGLLERIGWLRVCVDGETFRVRELRGVLERGRRERVWLAQRGV